jgi:POT family proton-dependent oligopeptide transporter
MIQNIHKSLPQPKALYLLFFVRTWECFSFYGMRALLVLYLINHIGVEDVRAYGIYAIYCSLVELSGVLGGRLADRLFGLRRSIVCGGWLIAAGHVCLSIESHFWVFLSGLALIVVGSGLFSSNISALLGLFYEDDDARREKGFTLFYMGINIGALLATFICGVIGETYGWHYGFSLAAIGMIIGNVLFLYYHELLEGKGELLQKPPERKKKIFSYILLLMTLPACAMMIAWEDIFMPIMPCLCLLGILYVGKKMIQSESFTKEKLTNIGVYLAALAIFYAAEDQTACALLIFSERYATDAVAGIPLPITTLLGLNPFVIIFGGFLVNKLNIGKNASSWLVLTGLLLAAAVFAGLSIACLFPNQEGLIPLEFVAMGILIISLGEVLLGPAILSHFSKVAPKEWLGVTMGLIPLGLSLGTAISGIFSKWMAVGKSASANALEIYMIEFSHLSLLLGLMALLVLLGQPYLYNLFNRKQKEIS